MFEARIEMVLHPECHDVGEMAMVDVRIDPEQPFENDFDHRLKLSRKGDAWVGVRSVVRLRYRAGMGRGFGCSAETQPMTSSTRCTLRPRP